MGPCDLRLLRVDGVPSPWPYRAKSHAGRCARRPPPRQDAPPREALLEYTRVRREQRASMHAIAGEVGVSDATLIRWSKIAAENGSGKLLPVQVLRVAASGSDGIIVHGPGGVRVQGFDVRTGEGSNPRTPAHTSAFVVFVALFPTIDYL